MNKLLFKSSGLHKPLYCILVIVSFFYCSLSTAQQKVKQNKKASHSSSRDIRYGVASFYADKFNGRPTASGEIFSQDKMTCACNVLPLGTWLKVTNLLNGKFVEVVVNDRLHPKMHRLVDLSKKAAKKLGFISYGLVKVKVEVIKKVK
jgi:rare lipoprotein A